VIISRRHIWISSYIYT